ncbi:MAG: redoxin domain-containing protein [Candidatus Eremiobacteraeota bacterium]|nr:redoxin domain-containing protein [Candidatus Eremiobacteraeota bacterium]MBC5820804.1 redoxin domain-containing protein [Candidatus Eremiobacteraeota bacterium]
MKCTVFFVAVLVALQLHTPGFAASPTGLGPVLAGHTWLNGRVMRSGLRGRVVLVDVFTFECINCVRVTPNLQHLYRTYGRRDLEIVAVHTPEVPSYQSRLTYLRSQIGKASIAWPIVVDNDYRIWRAYGVSAWPTQLLFDRNGRLRATIVGDSQDAALNGAIAGLIRH